MLTATVFPDLEQLLPHRERAILIDGVVSHSPDGTTCRALLQEGHPYLEEGRVPGVLALELMAQTAGVHAALAATQSGPGAAAPEMDARAAASVASTSRPISGYLLAAPEFTVFSGDFALHDELLITVRPVYAAPPLAKYAAEVEVKGVQRASGELSVFMGQRSNGGPTT